MTDNIRSKIAAWVDSEYGSCPVAGTQLLAFIDSQQAKVAALKAERDELRKAVDAVAELIRSSYGVAGLHLSGDVAPWSDLLTGGRFEEWLVDFDAAIAKAEGRKE